MLAAVGACTEHNVYYVNYMVQGTSRTWLATYRLEPYVSPAARQRLSHPTVTAHRQH